MRARRIFILTGEGIECEREAQRFFSLPLFGSETEMCPVPKILSGGLALTERAQGGDWVFFPGGFSFADHYGSGRLLSYELRTAGLFDALIGRGVNLMGACNGFQVLVEGGLFGRNLSLEANEVGGRAFGFHNRWVECRGAGPLKGENYTLCVRHGEGRLHRQGAWAEGVQPLLHYNDAAFDNGSIEGTAGLIARRGDSRIIGLMPHPEVSARPADAPDACGPEFMPDFRRGLFEARGDGVRFMQRLFDDRSEE